MKEKHLFSIVFILIVLLMIPSITYAQHQQVNPNGKDNAAASQADKEKVQTKIITGLITDGNNEPIVGATIMETTSKIGTITDFNGKFSLEVPVESVIQVSYIGYKPTQVNVGRQNYYEINLQKEAKTLNKVVIVNYKTQKKINLTKSIISTQGTVLQKSSSVNTSQSLAGRMPGVIVNNQNKEPG